MNWVPEKEGKVLGVGPLTEGRDDSFRGHSSFLQEETLPRSVPKGAPRPRGGGGVWGTGAALREIQHRVDGNPALSFAC